MTTAAEPPKKFRWSGHIVGLVAGLAVGYSLAIAQKDNHAATFTDRTSYHRFIHFGFPLVALDIHEKEVMPKQIATSQTASLRYPAAITNVLLGLLLIGATWWLAFKLTAALSNFRFSLGSLLILIGGVAIFLAGATQSSALSERLNLELARSWPSDIAQWMPKWPIVAGFAAAAIAASATMVRLASWTYLRIAGRSRSR